MFLNLCFFLTNQGYENAVEKMRRNLHKLLRHWEDRGYYKNPDNVCGYTSAISLPLFGCVGFTHRDSNEDVIYNW